jgi:hypothetical protein
MTDDLKQRADAAWKSMGWGLDSLRAAVEASIQAALAPLVERVAMAPKSARCTSILQGVDGGWPSLLCSLSEGHEGDHQNYVKGVIWSAQPPPAEAKCAECGGHKFICDVAMKSISYAQHGFGLRGCTLNGTKEAACNFNRRPCPACAKPEAGKTSGAAPSVAAVNPVAVRGPDETAATSAQKAPERVTLCRMWLAHDPSDDVCEGWGDSEDATFGFQYVRVDLLTAVNARVEELEKNLTLAIDKHHFLPRGACHYCFAGFDKSRAEGRAAGIREAMRVCEQSTVGIMSRDNPGVHAIHGRIFALLDKAGREGGPEREVDPSAKEET